MNCLNFRRISTNLVKAVLATTVVATGFVQPSFAVPKLEVLGTGYGGSGCPRGSASIYFSPNHQALNIRMNKFIANGNNSTQSRKSCNLTIPIKVPSGYQTSIRSADYRGYIAPATVGNLRAEYFFAGKRGSVFTRSLRSGSYRVRDNVKTTASSWSRCGDDVNLRVNTSMTAKGQSTAKVEQMVLNFGWRRCK